jgi:predicted amidohydrolase YtcJ
MWIRAFGYDEALVPERRHLTAEELDEAAPSHPVVLRHRTGHAAMINTRAARELKGLRPGDLLAPERLPDRLTPLAPTDFERSMGVCSSALAAAGVVAVADATAANDLSRLEALSRLVRSGAILQDVIVMPGIEHLGELVQAGGRFGKRLDDLRLGHAKIIPRDDDAWLGARVTEARRVDWPVAVHALDPAELDAALRALDPPPATAPAADRLEHVGLCLPNQLGKVRLAGVDVVTNPGFLISRAAKYEHELTPLEQDWLYPVRSLVRQGVRVAAASDAPVTDSSPLDSAQAAIRRGTDTRQFAPAEAVGPGAALGMVTDQAAHVMDGSPGRLLVGAPADFVVLGSDPLLVDPAALRDIQVMGTFRLGSAIFATEELLDRIDGVASVDSPLTAPLESLGLV